MKKLLFALCGLLSVTTLLAACGKVDPKNCKHETHDESAVCTLCGKTVSHTFSEGKCTVCGKSTPFLWESISQDETLMSAIKAGAKQTGTIERIVYETPAYNIEALTGEQKTIEKEAYVYLPYGYSADKEYDLLILLHGSTDSAGYWFAQGDYDPSNLGVYYNTGNLTKELLDFLIEQGKIAPTIVVTPTLYNEHENYQTENKVVTKQLGKELTDSLLPYLAEHYATYAEGTSKEALIQARDHFAYCGFSMGGFTGMDSILSYCLPYFSYVGTFSGASSDVETAVAGINRDCETYPVRYWYSSCGTLDGTVKFDSVKETYKTTLKGVPSLKDGENASFVAIAGANHTYECSLTALYNALQVFFR